MNAKQIAATAMLAATSTSAMALYTGKQTLENLNDENNEGYYTTMAYIIGATDALKETNQICPPEWMTRRELITVIKASIEFVPKLQDKPLLFFIVKTTEAFKCKEVNK